ncbi:MAG TPA: dethiobiotin synthase [Mycobacteriales bacterium]|nr:dethiobiotin synthase [Mycobacteriales bacterium]
MKRLVVTGTGTEIGKTIVTAALAALARAAGQRVAVVKAAQTGIEPGDESDTDVVTRLSGVDDVHELVRYPAPLAPASAARLVGIPATPVAELARRTAAITGRDLVLIEGAGGLLVRFDADGATMADLAADLGAEVLVVAPAGLGTLNSTALTCRELRRRSLTCAGVVVGSWPAAPDLASRTNLDDLPSYAEAPLLGVLPAGLGTVDRRTFLEAARAGLAPELGGGWHRPATPM